MFRNLSFSMLMKIPYLSWQKKRIITAENEIDAWNFEAGLYIIAGACYF